MNASSLRLSVLAASTALLFGCATTSPTTGGGNVSYGDAKAVETVSNEFGSTDLQTIAESMARSMNQFAAGAFKGRPIATVYDVKNKTSEYIDTRSITDSIKTQLTKGGAMRFTADNNAMQNQTDELIRQNQSGLYKQSSTAKVGKMEAAKYRIEGTITSIVKRNSDVKDVYYKFTLLLVDNESGITEWMDEKEIRKSSKR